MNTAILTVIMIIALIGLIILYELRAFIKDIPAKIVSMLFAKVQKELIDLKREIRKIKNELPDTGNKE